MEEQRDNPGGASRTDEPGPYELHERVDQELLREAQARVEVDGVDRGEPEVAIMSPAELDARRTLAKAEAVLRHAAVYFDRKDSMNAAQHLSDRVIQSPLHGEVLSVLAAIDLFKQGYQ